MAKEKSTVTTSEEKKKFKAADVFFQLDAQGDDFVITGTSWDTSFRGNVTGKAFFKMAKLAIQAFVDVTSKKADSIDAAYDDAKKGGVIKETISNILQ